MDPNNSETQNQPQAVSAPQEQVSVHTPPPEVAPTQEEPAPAPPQASDPAAPEKTEKAAPAPKQSQASPFDPPKENSVMPAIIGAIVFVLVLVGLVLYAYLKSKQ